MAYDPVLVEWLRILVREHFPDLVEKKMFGGFSYLRNGNSAFGANMDLVVRVEKDRYESTLEEGNVREMDFTGRPMKGWVYVEPVAIETDLNLFRWIESGVAFADTLPPK